MNASAAARRPSNDVATALTHVELTRPEKRIEHWIRFGRIAEEKILDRRRRIVGFRRWAALGLSCAGRRTTSARSSPASTSCAQLRRENPTRRCHSSVRAVGRILAACINGWPKVDQESCRRSTRWKPPASILPATPAPGHWRHIRNRLTAGEQRRPYTLARHKAWPMRRSIAP